MHPVNVPAKLEVRIALHVPQLIGGTQKFEGSLAMPTQGEAVGSRDGTVRRKLVSSYIGRP